MPTTDASERENEYYLLSRKSRRGCIIISKHNEELTFSYETLKNREVRHYRIVVCDNEISSSLERRIKSNAVYYAIVR